MTEAFIFLFELPEQGPWEKCASCRSLLSLTGLRTYYRVFRITEVLYFFGVAGGRKLHKHHTRAAICPKYLPVEIGTF